jgi:hypothetical protein
VLIAIFEASASEMYLLILAEVLSQSQPFSSRSDELNVWALTLAANPIARRKSVANLMLEIVLKVYTVSV